MSKVMIVEDDDSLREIYAIRLTAEGYAVVSAHDGEEALAVAVRERPDLIISDVMMPKISGFDMLDILRSTPETANIRVIMMTALSSEDQRERGEGLGADRYLVKSQVGIEDVVNTVHEVLGDRSADGTINPGAPVEQMPSAPAPAMMPQDPAMMMSQPAPVTQEMTMTGVQYQPDPSQAPMPEQQVALDMPVAPAMDGQPVTAPVAMPQPGMMPEQAVQMPQETIPPAMPAEPTTDIPPSIMPPVA